MFQNEHTVVLENIKTVRDESKEMELKFLNSSEDKISEIKFRYEAEIRELTESKTQLEIELENSKSKLREELNKASQDKQKIKTAVDDVINQGII